MNHTIQVFATSLLNTVPDNGVAIIDDATINSKTLLIRSLNMNNIQVSSEQCFDGSLSRVDADRHTTENTSDFQSMMT